MSTPGTPRTPDTHPTKTVYEIWKAFDFDTSIGRYQEVYEGVINNMTTGQRDKQDLVEHVRSFAGSLKGRSSCDVKEIETLMGHFKTSFARQLERASYSEKAFTDFYKNVAELSDPTSHLLSATVMNATVLKLEAEMEAMQQQVTSESSTADTVKQLQEAAKTEADRAEQLAAHTRALEGKLEAAGNETEDAKQKLSALAAQHDALQEKALTLSDELNKAQYNRDSKYEAAQEESNDLSQQLADALTRVQELSKGSSQSIEADALAEEVMELRSALSTKDAKSAAHTETIAALSVRVSSLEGELKEARKAQRSASQHTPAEVSTLETSKLKKAMLELSIPKAELISDEYDAAACLRELYDRSTGLGHSLKAQKAETEALRSQVQDLTLSLDTSNDSLMAMRERLHSLNEEAGGGDEGFDLGRLVGGKEHSVVDIEGARDDVAMLTSQRATLRQKITGLEARNDRLIGELDRVRRKVHALPTSPPPPPAHPQRHPTAFDTFTHNIMKVLNTNSYTRAFAVAYVAFLHLFVFVVLFSLTKEYSDHRRVVERHSF